MDSKDKYLQRFKVRLNEFYLQIRDYDNKDVAMAQGIEAYMEAGLALGAVSTTELEMRIATEHVSVFGVSRQERLQEAKTEALGNGDYAFFDTPAFQREKG